MLVYNHTQDGFIEVCDETETWVIAYLGYDALFKQWELCELETSLCVLELEQIIKKLKELNDDR